MTTKPAKPDPAEQWKPTDRPGVEINGHGRFRTVGDKWHLPPAKPLKPEPVSEGTVEEWTEGCIW